MMVHRGRATLFAIAMLVLAGLLAACGNQEPTQVPTSTSVPTPAPEEVSLALDWFPNSNHAGFYAALERGYYRDEGLDVNIYVPANPEDVLKTVGAGPGRLRGQLSGRGAFGQGRRRAGEVHRCDGATPPELHHVAGGIWHNSARPA